MKPISRDWLGHLQNFAQMVRMLNDVERKMRRTRHVPDDTVVAHREFVKRLGIYEDVLMREPDVAAPAAECIAHAARHA